MKEAKEMIYYLATGISKWEKEPSKIPEELIRGHAKWVNMASKEGSFFPPDIYSLIKILSCMAKNWDLPDVNKVFPSDSALIDKYAGLTIEAEDFLEYYKSPDEAEHENMKEILKYCRNRTENNDGDSLYSKVRLFMSNPNNAVISGEDLFEFFQGLQDIQLAQLVMKCYEDLPHPIENYRECPNCKWTMEYKRGQWKCNKDDICKALKRSENWKLFKFKGNSKIKRLLPGIQKCVLLPGMAEIRIGEKLKRKGYRINYYPNIDEYDMEIISSSGEMKYVDVKDYRNPLTLAFFFNEKSQEALTKYDNSTFVVVPDYRKDLYNSYVKQSKQALKPELRQKIRIVMENDLRELVGK